MIKNSGKDGGQDYSEREVKVILEDIEGQFRVFGEGFDLVNGRLEKIETRLDRVEEKVDRLDLKVTGLEYKVTGLEHKVTSMDITLSSIVPLVKDHEQRLKVLETHSHHR